jgi:hypothetical protein
MLEAMIHNVGNNVRFDNHVTEYVCELDVIASHGKIKIKKRRMNLIEFNRFDCWAGYEKTFVQHHSTHRSIPFFQLVGGTLSPI